MPPKRKASPFRGGSGGGGASKNNKFSIDFGVNDSDEDDGLYGDDHVHSDDESSIGGGGGMLGSDIDDADGDDEDRETVDAKRIRLARNYLSKMERKVGGAYEDSDASNSSDKDSSSDEESDRQTAVLGPSQHDKIGSALARQRQKREGTLERRVAGKTQKAVAEMWANRTSSEAALDDFRSFVDNGIISLYRGHDLTPTSVALHCHGISAYSASKDNSILMWDVERSTKLSTICPQWKTTNRSEPRADGEVLAMACSDDGRYLAAGQRDAKVKIYDVRVAGKSSGGKLVTTFRGHKGPITSLAFRPNTLQLFTASDDRCLRHHNLEEMAYVETLYGHQAGVTAVSCTRRERPISAGRDRTVRTWKIAEETHLIHRPGGRVSSADCLCAVNDTFFLSGHDDGYLNLWNADKKRPVDTIESAHGMTETGLSRGIASTDALANSDLAVTGSSDGYLRLWNLSPSGDHGRGLESIGRIPLHGFINDVAIGPKARFCVAAIGQEPRLGRWDRVPKAKNRFAIIRLRTAEDCNDDDDEEKDGNGFVEQGKYESSEGDSASSDNGAEESESD